MTDVVTAAAPVVDVVTAAAAAVIDVVTDVVTTPRIPYPSLTLLPRIRLYPQHEGVAA